MSAVAWRRVVIAGAGVSVDQHPDWSVVAEDGIVYQRGPEGETVSVRWGPDATVEYALAHVGLGSAGSTRTVEADAATDVAGTPARRLRVRVVGPDVAPAGGAALPAPPREVVFAFLGLRSGDTPVLAGYRIAAGDPAEPLVEHILASVAPARG